MERILKNKGAEGLKRSPIFHLYNASLFQLKSEYSYTIMIIYSELRKYTIHDVNI